MAELIELKQKHMEAYARNIRALKPSDVGSVFDLSGIEYRGILVRAAIQAGWFEDVDPDTDVGEMTHKATEDLYADIVAATTAAQGDPKN